MWFVVADASFVGFDDVIITHSSKIVFLVFVNLRFHGFGFNVMCSATLRTQNFSKEKKRKKKAGR